jgi:hypothetical protein
MRLYPELAQKRASQVMRDLLVLLALVLFAVLARAVHSSVMALTAISEGFTSSATGAQDAWNGVGDSLAGIPLVGESIRQTFEDLASATFGNAAETGQSVTDAVTLAANVLAFVTFAAPTAVLLVLWLPRRLDRARAWDAAYRVLAAVPAPQALAGVTVSPQSPLLGPSAPDAPEAPPDPRVGSGGVPAAHRPDQWNDTLALPRGAGVAEPPARSQGVGASPDHPAGAPVSFPPEELLALRALCHLPFEDLARFSARPFEAFAAGDYAPLVAALYAHEGLVPPAWSTSPD